MSTRGAHYVGLVRLDARGRWQARWVGAGVVGWVEVPSSVWRCICQQCGIVNYKYSFVANILILSLLHTTSTHPSIASPLHDVGTGAYACPTTCAFTGMYRSHEMSTLCAHFMAIMHASAHIFHTRTYGHRGAPTHPQLCPPTTCKCASAHMGTRDTHPPAHDCTRSST
jgi:hypothetical protein